MGVKPNIKQLAIRKDLVIRGLLGLVFLLVSSMGMKAINADSLLTARLNFGADSPLEITYVISDSRIPGYLDINIRAVFQDTVVDYKYLEDSLRVREIVNGNEEALDVQKVSPQAFDMVTIIVDISSSMWRSNGNGGVFVDDAKYLCDSILSLMENNYMVNLYTFDERIYRVTAEGENSIQNVKRPLEARYTHLYECVDASLDLMANAKGKKLLIIIGDGENDHNKKLPVLVNRDDLLEKIRGLDTTYHILPIAIGPQIYEQNLRQIVASSARTDDTISTGMPGNGFWDEVKSLKEWEFTHTILMKSKLHPHIGEERKVFIELGDGPRLVADSTTYKLGMLYDPWNEQAGWQQNYLLGGLICFLLFVLFAFLVPWRQWVDFRSKYVKFYWEVKEEGVQRYDPLTKFPFRDDDQVVVRCEHMQSLETWQYEGRKSGGGKNDTGQSNRKRKGQCMYHPHKCDSGQGPSGISDFFAQKDFYKYLMWLLWGVIGGFVGWCVWALTKESDPNWANDMIRDWSLQPDVADAIDVPDGATKEDGLRLMKEQFLGPTLYQILLGISTAFFITVAIALGMELASNKGKWNLVGIGKLLGRLLLRGVAAGILAGIVFAGFGFGQYFLMPSSPYLFGLIALLLLGIIVGRALTTSTGIRNIRGFLAGLAGAFVAFHIYYMPMWFSNGNSFEGSKMIAFMAMGGIIGYILSRSAPALEASELDIYTGRKRYGTAYVTDLLRKNEDVIIGRGPTATVRLKVRYTTQINAPGNITQPFARLELRNEVVYLVPEIFTEVNGEAVAPNERVPLIDGDRITFDHKSPSHLRYREFRTGPHPRRRRKIGRKGKEDVNAPMERKS